MLLLICVLEKPWYRQPEWVAVGLTAIYVTLTAFYVLFAWLTLSAIKDQAKENQRQFEKQLKVAADAAEAARQSADAAKVSSQIILNAERAWILVELERTGVGHDYNLKVTNWGKTPAIITSYGFRTDGVPIEIKELPENLSFVARQNQNIIIRGGGDSKILDHFEMSHYMSEWWQDIQVGRRTGIFAVTVEYWDVLKGIKPHEAQVVYSYKVSESRLVILPKYTQHT